MHLITLFGRHPKIQSQPMIVHILHSLPDPLQTQMPDPKTFKQHFESKHPKSPMPPELVDVEA
jgi:hypothetical protein